MSPFFAFILTVLGLRLAYLAFQALRRVQRQRAQDRAGDFVVEIWLYWGAGPIATMYRHRFSTWRRASNEAARRIRFLETMLPLRQALSLQGRTHSLALHEHVRLATDLERATCVRELWTSDLPGTRGFRGESSIDARLHQDQPASSRPVPVLQL